MLSYPHSRSGLVALTVVQSAISTHSQAVRNIVHYKGELTVMSPMRDSELVETSFVNTVLPRSTTMKKTKTFLDHLLCTLGW